MREQNGTSAPSGGKVEKRTAAVGPIERIAAEHALQLELCDALEYIADGLPDSIDRRLVREVIAILGHGLDAHFRAEEQLLFPLLRRRGNGDLSLIAALDQLEMEHVRDEDISSELMEELAYLAEHGRARNAEMLGYMLRGFFEGQRRHIAWENAVVVPAARRLLLPEDLQNLSSLLGSAPLRTAALRRSRTQP
jgi:hemerythrin-like domain-containing protein